MTQTRCSTCPFRRDRPLRPTAMGKGPTRAQLSDSPVTVRRPVVPTLPPTEIEEKGHVTFFETVNIVKPERDVRTSADTSRFPVLLSMPPRIHIDKRHLRTPVEGNPIDAGASAVIQPLVDQAVSKLPAHTLECAYQAYLGFYNSYLKRLRWDREEVVRMRKMSTMPWLRENIFVLPRRPYEAVARPTGPHAHAHGLPS